MPSGTWFTESWNVRLGALQTGGQGSVSGFERARERVGNFGKHRTGQGAGPCGGSWSSGPSGVAFTEEQASSETRPHHAILGLIWGLELPPSEVSGPHSCTGKALSPPGTSTCVSLGGCFTLWEFQGEKSVGRREVGLALSLGCGFQGVLLNPDGEAEQIPLFWSTA